MSAHRTCGRAGAGGGRGGLTRSDRRTARGTCWLRASCEGAVRPEGGAGKSTLAERLSLAFGAPALNLDEWMVVLFAPDRPAEDFLPWYGERKARCTEQIWCVACAVLDAGSDVVLELGLVGRPEREAFYHRVGGTEHPLTVYLLEPPRALRQERVRRRNVERSGTFRMEVSEEIFALADRAWQSPDAAERASRCVVEVADSRAPITSLGVPDA